jgi:hypothetical protein
MKFLRSTFLTALLALIGGAVYAGCTAKFYYTQNSSVGLRYALTKSWGIRSSYQYGYGINSMLKSYDQLPQTNAIQFGVEYKIK